MAAATTSPVKILSDLGYEIWEMEIPEDFRSALIEAINTLIMSNPSDGRIPILQEAIRAVQKPKFKSKKTRLNVSKVLNKTQPRLEGQKLQEDSEEVQSNNGVLSSVLVPRLDGISSALSGIGSILASQLSLERIAYERQRKRDLLNEKREREKSLENEGNTIGKTLKKIIQQPIKSFGERLLQFLKSVGLGAAVLSLYKWLQDEENLKKVKDIADWLGNNGAILIKSILKLGRLKIASMLSSLILKLGKAITPSFILKPVRFLIKALVEAGARMTAKLLGREGIKSVFKTSKAFEKARRMAIEGQRLKDKTKIKNILKIAGVEISSKGLDRLTLRNLSKFLSKRKGLSQGEIATLYRFAEAQGVIKEGTRIALETAIPKPKVGLATRFGNLFKKKKKLDVSLLNKVKKIPADQVRAALKKVKDSGIGLKTNPNVLGVGKLLTGFLGFGLKSIDIGWDGYDAWRTWQKEDKVSSLLYALASIATVSGRPILSVGLSGLARTFEDDALPQSLNELKIFGALGGFETPEQIDIFQDLKEPIEGEYNFNEFNKRGNMGIPQASLMPNDPNDSGGNIAMLGGNGSQSTLSAGNNSNGTEVMTNSSTNPSDNQSINTGSVYQVSVA